MAFTLDRTGLRPALTRIVATGGAMSSPFWAQVIADVCGLVVDAVDFPAFTAYGAALHAKQAQTGAAAGAGVSVALASRTYTPRRSNGYRNWYESCQRDLLRRQAVERG